MIEKINYCFSEHKIASLYFDKQDTNNHLTGYISQYNESEILINHITPNGNYDGYIIKHIEELYRIDYDGEYEKKIENLYKLRSQSHIAVKFLYDEIIYTMIDFAKNNNFIITFEFENNEISGILKQYDNEFVEISIVNNFGEECGSSVFDLNEVLTVAIDTDYEQSLNLLRINQIK